MTPEMLTGLALLLLEFREWNTQDGQVTLDREAINHVIDVIGLARQKLVMDGAE